MDEYHQTRLKIRRDARAKIGSKYQYAAKGPNRFDCSGLVHYTYSRQGIDVPSSSRQLAKLGKGIKVAEAKPGDLVFFKKNGRIFHVSIITQSKPGQLWVVHSTSSKGVIEQDILASPYWRTKLNKLVSFEDIAP